MKNRWKQWVGSALALALSVSMLTSCGSAAGSGSTASTANSASAASSSNVPIGERPKIKMFMCDSGSPLPEGWDVSDNKFINYIEDYAGVDLEIIQPPYADYTTQYGLMIASGDLPDIIHTYVVDDLIKYGDQGAFMDLKEYYDNSPVVQAICSEDAMELSRSASGNYYRIPQGTAGYMQGYENWIRYDWLEEYNGGVYPTDVDGYVDFLYWVKENYPDSVPLACRYQSDRIFMYGEVFFKWFGAMPQSYNVVDGEVVSTFVQPAYRDAVELYRQLYADGILDKEFANTAPSDYSNKVNAGMVAMGTTTPRGLQASYNIIASQNNTGAFFAFTPELETYPENLIDPIYTKGHLQTPIGIHGLSIASTCKNPDLAWKVIEAFATEELREMAEWGDEGVYYEVVDGKRVPIVEAMNTPEYRYGTPFMILHGFSSIYGAQNATHEQIIGEKRWPLQIQGNEHCAADAEERGYAMMDVKRYISGLLQSPSVVLEREPEANQFIAEATVNAITGQISMDQFDQMVETFKTQYSDITDAWTEILHDNMDYLLKMGCKDAAL